MKEFLTTLGLSLLAVLAPIHGVLIMTGCLIAFDLVTGIWRAVKVGEKLTSNGFRRTITKICAYNIAIVTGFILEQMLLGGMVPAVKIISGIIAITECKSILENLSKITGLDFIAEIKKKLSGSKEVDK